MAKLFRVKSAYRKAVIKLYLNNSAACVQPRVCISVTASIQNPRFLGDFDRQFVSRILCTISFEQSELRNRASREAPLGAAWERPSLLLAELRRALDFVIPRTARKQNRRDHLSGPLIARRFLRHSQRTSQNFGAEIRDMKYEIRISLFILRISYLVILHLSLVRCTE